MDGHKLLPARSPNGARIEELIKGAYQLEQDKSYGELVNHWYQIIKLAENEARRSLQLAYPNVSHP